MPKKKKKPKVTAFSNLISEATSHHFCRILAIRSESLGPAYSQGEGCESQEVRVVRRYLRSCLPSCPCSLPGVLVTLWIIDRLGRKKTMALCFTVFSFCSLLLFICVGRWVLKPALSGQQADFSGCGQWLFEPAGCGLHPLWVI